MESVWGSELADDERALVAELEGSPTFLASTEEEQPYNFGRSISMATYSRAQELAGTLAELSGPPSWVLPTLAVVGGIALGLAYWKWRR